MESEIVFRAMADGTRQRTLVVLTRHELSVSELVEVLNQPQSTVSRHLKTLRDAGLIHDRRQGSTVMYSVRTPTNERNGSALTGRMLEWIAEQSLAGSLRTRLDTVIHRRQGMSDEFFTQVGRHWDSLREEAFGATFHLEAVLALLPADWTVADVGTGTGYLLPALASHFDQVIGVDPVEEMLEAARHRVQTDALGNVKLRQGDLSRLPVQGGAVDLAVAMLVLHHVPSPQEAVAEMCRIVRDNGRILIVEQTAHEHEAFRKRMHDHWWGFEPAELERLVESIGFEQVRSKKLVTADCAADAPELFVVTGHRPARDK
ncbi:MAG: ArsR/SmtB family transcription factor [Planctomycetota bacterium]|jgi:ArsR family transcriptional regulator